MATQYDSYDISKLRDFALGIPDADEVRLSAFSVSASAMPTGLLTPSTLQFPDPEQDLLAPTLAAEALEARAANIPKEQSPKKYSTKVPLKNAADIVGDGTRRERRAPNRPRKLSAYGQGSPLRASASPPQLPSTIPDSLAGRMATMGSQSEGDTQPLSQRAREEFASKIREQHAELQSEVASESVSKWFSTSRNYQPEEAGHIDLLDGFQQPFGTATQEVGELQDDDIDHDSQPADVHVELFPESRRFQQPITPATTSRKRQRVGSSLSRENTTPRLPINPFAGQPAGLGDMMNSSQAFKATQFTSPMPDGLPSDALSERPSPDLFNAKRPSTADPISSPVRVPRSHMTRAVTEPRTTYVSMAESQAERDKRKREFENAQEAAGENGWDDDFDWDEEDFRRQRLRQIERQSRDEFAKVTAKARPTPARRGRGGRKQQTPRTASGRKRSRMEREAVFISDDPVAEGNVTEDETEHEETEQEVSGTDSPDELCEENKENYNSKDLHVPLTVSRVGVRRAPANVEHATPPRRRFRRSPSPEAASDDRQEIMSGQIAASTGVAGEMLIATATATVTIADSQPSHPTYGDASSKSIQERTQVRESSEEQRLFVPQSQLPGTFTANHSHRHIGDTSSEGLICIPASSSTSSLQRRRPRKQQSSLADVSSTGGAEPSPSMDTPAPTHDIHSSPHQLESTGREVASKDSANDAMGAIEVASGLPHFAESAIYQPRSRINLPKNNVTSSAYSEKVLHTKSPQERRQARSFRTIPETSSAEVNLEPALSSSAPPASTNTSSKLDSRIPFSEVNGTSSGPSTLFDTAVTHMTITPKKPNAGATFQDVARTPTPRQSRAKTLLEIANATSPPVATNDMDVDVNLLTADDLEYQAIISGSSPVQPARKRRRGRAGRVLHVEEAQSDDQPTLRVLVPSGEETNSDAVDGSNQAKAQLPTRDATPTAAEISPIVSPVQPISKPRLLTESASKKRGRPKKAKLPAEMPAPEATNGSLKSSPMKASRAELPPIETTSEAHDVDEGMLDSVSIIAPNQVFAHFNGNCAAFYPATCIGQAGGKDPQYRVRFDDGTVDVINGFGIKRLELRPGDNVKLDSGGNRKRVYVVVRMQDKQQPMLTPDPETPTRRNLPGQASAATFAQTDIRGYASVVVRQKQANNTEQQPDETLTVPVRDIYFTQTMWTSLKDRSYSYTTVRSHLSSRLETPLERSSVPATPSSRSHRIKASGLGPSRSVKGSASNESTLFDNMVFAITNIAETSSRTALNNLISKHGGSLLTGDFSELFHIPSLGPVSPSKRSPKRDPDTSFHLTEAASHMGFTCLIADKHCRMAKYIQALALGIPCLSSRWIEDCVTKQTVIAWEPYLLAAGESSFLNGAVRSRIIPSFDPLTITLPEIVEARPKPLDKSSVMLIMEKNEEETMRSHPLLSHALGATKVSRATSVDAAATMLAEAEASGAAWDWVYSHDKEEKVKKLLLGKGRASSSGAGKKRKRGSSAMSRAADGEGFKAKVVGNEFVVQSLILGKLVDMD